MSTIFYIENEYIEFFFQFHPSTLDWLRYELYKFFLFAFYEVIHVL
jgi:hypothetical protein